MVFVFGRIIAVVFEDWFPSIESSKQSTAQPLTRLESNPNLVTTQSIPFFDRERA